MERRYLAATLALVATFAIFSREFRSGHLANLPSSRTELISELKCARQYVTDQLLAKARPFIQRGVPEEAQMVAELNLPVLAGVHERVAAVEARVVERATEKQCDAAIRAQEQALRAQEAGFRAQERGLRAAERVQERAAELSLRASERAQRIAARATERAQRVMWNSPGVFPPPPVAPTPAVAPVPPLPIDFEVTLPSDFDQQVQAAIDSHITVKCVRSKAAAQQVRTVTVQRANQNLVKNVNVVVTTQDVSGLSWLTHSPASQSAIHRLQHDVQHFQDHALRTIDRAFATL